MRQTLTKNDKSLKILNLLIVNGFYSGFVESEKFELHRNHFPNNQRIIGILNENGKYVVKSDLKFPTNIAAKTLLIFGILTSIILLIKGNFLIPVFFVIGAIIFTLVIKFNSQKEIDLFTNKFLEFDKMEYK
ncbi:hypothetical protein [Confluentibacter flavum]|uniref:Uncharacterized protein n=1 Tax=Confluentibacter flavum TaxID=1909700 RepID=A0A2N3HIX2_9FLAO|nr:hypothetical protein [Confluentibacter flavum]PKQ44778.1 hypothetical protein CSW08_11725 [Confluentibacter flavum]